MEKYARRCDVTQEGMNHGYCILDGWMYIKYEKDMLQHITDETDYNDIEEAYKSDYFYYTDWHDTIDEEDEWYTEDGRWMSEEETIQENIDRLQGYYDDCDNGLNTCFLLKRIKELRMGA